MKYWHTYFIIHELESEGRFSHATTAHHNHLVDRLRHCTLRFRHSAIGAQTHHLWTQSVQAERTFQFLNEIRHVSQQICTKTYYFFNVSFFLSKNEAVCIFRESILTRTNLLFNNLRRDDTNNNKPLELNPIWRQMQKE